MDILPGRRYCGKRGCDSGRSTRFSLDGSVEAGAAESDGGHGSRATLPVDGLT